MHKIFTIGAYGYDEETYFRALKEREIDTFCDIRLRRGMRGRDYCFVNKMYLQNKLELLGINYIHLKELAPSKETRSKQTQLDKAAGVAKRNRTGLSQAFIADYTKHNLEPFNSNTFLWTLGGQAKNIVLFCVEQHPNACHRTILAEHLNKTLDVPIEHIVL